MISLDFLFYARVPFGFILAAPEQNALAGGWLLFEIGYTQGQAVSDLLLAEGYTDIRLIPDYNGNDRVVAARWQPAER